MVCLDFAYLRMLAHCSFDCCLFWFWFVGGGFGVL